MKPYSVALAVVALLALAAPMASATALFPNATRAGAPSFEEDTQLANAVGSPLRSEAHKARDVWRHPYESLTFWGLAPGMTVIEIAPGGEAWWTEILLPYARATGGRYVAAYNDPRVPNYSDAARKGRADFDARFGVASVDFGMISGLGAADGSADLVLVARAFHNWARTEGQTDRYLAEFFRVLKPGGVLAVEQHRAPADSDVAVTAPNGYVPESYVIAAAQRAGFVLEARSELNANAADTRNHPFGVWTLPPVRRSAPPDQPANPDFDHRPYDAIGESDRMTLRFRKPA
ncbi:MAG: methyltransferase domain-containing protein [Caulobacteraceae bacterium]|nr:methyltransferase domain-containing protein [Caulobacteraceae bacterium]